MPNKLAIIPLYLGVKAGEFYCLTGVVEFDLQHLFVDVVLEDDLWVTGDEGLQGAVEEELVGADAGPCAILQVEPLGNGTGQGCGNFIPVDGVI